MKNSILLFLIVFMLMASGCQNDLVANGQSVDGYIKEMNGKNNVSVVSPIPEGVYYDVLDKRVEGIEENFQWFSEYTKNNVYPYPYNEKFGITKQEYNNLLDGTYMNLEEIGTANFACKKVGNRVYEISIDSSKLEFNIDTNKNEITMSTGEILPFSKEVTADAENQHLSGPWNGYTFTSIESSSSTDTLASYNIHDNTYNIGYENVIPQLVDFINCKLVSISIGKFSNKDEYLIYYRYINTNELETNYLLYYLQ